MSNIKINQLEVAVMCGSLKQMADTKLDADCVTIYQRMRSTIQESKGEHASALLEMLIQEEEKAREAGAVINQMALFLMKAAADFSVLDRSHAKAHVD